MKKFSYILLSLILCLACLAIAGCSSDERNNTVDLSKIEVGAEIPVYPNCEFDYVLTPHIEGSESNKEYTFHVSSFTATLIKKNSIQEGDKLTETFYPFEVQVSLSGYTSQDLAGYTLSVIIWHESLIDLSNIRCLISSSGDFSGTITFGVYSAQPALFYFTNISNYLF